MIFYRDREDLAAPPPTPPYVRVRIRRFRRRQGYSGTSRLIRQDQIQKWKVGLALDMGHFNLRTLRLEKSDHGKTPTH